MDRTKNMIFRGNSWLGDVGVAELDCVGLEGGLGVFIDEVVAAVVLEVWDNVEAFMQAELPGFAVVGLDVDENQAAKGDNWSGIVVESAIEVLPGRELQTESGLEKEVEC